MAHGCRHFFLRKASCAKKMKLLLQIAQLSSQDESTVDQKSRCLLGAWSTGWPLLNTQTVLERQWHESEFQPTNSHLKTGVFLEPFFTSVCRQVRLTYSSWMPFYVQLVHARACRSDIHSWMLVDARGCRSDVQLVDAVLGCAYPTLPRKP